MKVLTVGGGSGGHVTPVAAVVSILRRDHPDAEIRMWCDRKFSRQARQTMHTVDPKLPVETIFSGKFRRYHTMPLWKQLLQIRTIVLPNIRDGLYIFLGTIQSFVKLVLWRPDVVFSKGGYVCLPVGCAAYMLRIPIVVHDSDAYPGLTNRVLSRWAIAIGTGAPLKHYNYPVDKARYVGIPVGSTFKKQTVPEQKKLKAELGFSLAKPLVVVTGGGLGAGSINTAIVSSLDELLTSCSVLLISGTGSFVEIQKKTQQYSQNDFQLKAFVSKNMVEILAAADVVVARAGATTLLELATLAKPTIIVPNPYLTGGHQLKNAEVYSDAQAAVIVDELRMSANRHELLDTINALVLNQAEQARLSKAIHGFAKPHAARDMATMIEQAALSEIH